MDFKQYGRGKTAISAAEISEPTEIQTVGGGVLNVNDGFVVERPDSDRGIYDYVPRDEFSKLYNVEPKGK